MSKDNGGPAFPSEVYEEEGMTLRDYFAAKAMQAFIANPDDDWGDMDEISATAYRYADTMLEARAK